MLNTMDRQFEQPKGFFGRIAGFIMSLENKKINKWTIRQLNPHRGDTILEIGYGPGYAINELMETKRRIIIHGIDLSSKMKQMAERKNRDYIHQGRVRLFSGDINDYKPAHLYDKVFSVNNYPLWEHQEQSLKKIHDMMSIDGKIALTVQPREEGADETTTKALGAKIQSDLENAGFKDISISYGNFRPILTVCVTGRKR
jgi:cyclopropane fatty-acyl-phospholipid synthase-like methyltransferase